MKKKKIPKASTTNFVVVTNKSYGKNLKGIKIYYEGKKPKYLSTDGKINFGKNILELLQKKYKRFRWIITTGTDSITLERGIYRIRTSAKTLSKMYSEQFSRNRDIKNDIIASVFSQTYPNDFTSRGTSNYSAGTIAQIVNKSIIPRLSSEDRDALNSILPDFLSSESLSSVNLLKAVTQIKTLKDLASELRNAIEANYSESWWQKYVKKNILIIQQGYIKAIEKMNVTIGGTKYPDFSLVTHDNYLDIMEIKKPTTKLTKYDDGRDNYYWDSEITKAIIQTENYIENISKQSEAGRNYIKDKYQIDLKIVKPRGIILAGNRSTFVSQKEKDDFRLLCQSAKNITFITYDELLQRLNNYIEVLEEHSQK